MKSKYFILIGRKKAPIFTKIFTFPLMNPKNQSKTLNCWAMYDWANSVYSLVITSTIFPIYYNSVVGDSNGLVILFGKQFNNTALYSFSLSFSFLIIMVLSPILSGMADYGGMKKQFMKFFCYLGSLSCIALFWFNGENVIYGLSFFMLAGIGFSGSLVFYNAFLPEIATPDKQDSVSAKGFSLGYFGSVILLVFCLVMVMKPEVFGITDPSMPPKISFLLVGFWWMGFAQITFFNLKEEKRNSLYHSDILLKGFKELKSAIKKALKSESIKTFLSSFFFYSLSVQTVMYVAAIFGSKELNLESSQLIITILIIQLIAILGAWFFSKVSMRKGNKWALLCLISVWIFICIAAYFTTTANQFFALAAAVGLVMGGIQSLSRSTFSKIIGDTKDTASFFSLFDVLEKGGIVLGTLLFGLIDQITGSMRLSILVFIFFFALGLLLLLRLKVKFTTN